MPGEMNCARIGSDQHRHPAQCRCAEVLKISVESRGRQRNKSNTERGEHLYPRNIPTGTVGAWHFFASSCPDEVISWILPGTIPRRNVIRSFNSTVPEERAAVSLNEGLQLWKIAASR